MNNTYFFIRYIFLIYHIINKDEYKFCNKRELFCKINSKVARSKLGRKERHCFLKTFILL